MSGPLVSQHRGKNFAVKVRLGDVGLVIPVGKDTDKIERLTHDIGVRFENHGIKAGELRIAELKTGDGFLLNPNDVIRDVISEGEHLIALDYDEWIEQQIGFCKTEWVKMVCEDFVDSVEKWVIVGLHEHNKLFVKFGLHWPGGRNQKVTRLELYDVEALQHFAKEGKVLLASKKGEKDEWKEEAYFIIEKGTVKAVEVVVQSTSDPRPLIKQLSLKVGRKLEQGEVKLIQSNKDEFDPAVYKGKIPARTATGPVLPEDPAESPTKEEEDVSKNHSTGDSSLQLTQKAIIYGDQGWVDSKTGQYDNAFYSTFKLINTADREIAVVKVSSEYEAKPGEWKDMKTLIGNQSSFYYYRWGDKNETNFNMEPLEQRELSVNSFVTITAPQVERMRRAHRSLPDPLNIRITFEELTGAKSTIVVTHHNPSRELAKQKERRMKNTEGKKLLLWDQCDDVEADARITVSMCQNEDDHRIELYLNDSGKYLYWKSSIPEVAFNAATAKQAEFKVDDWRWEDKSCTIQGYGLVDVEKKRLYGIKVELKTSTSTVTNAVLLPKASLAEE